MNVPLLLISFLDAVIRCEACLQHSTFAFSEFFSTPHNTRDSEGAREIV